jgi:hypothetical protein
MKMRGLIIIVLVSCFAKSMLLANEMIRDPFQPVENRKQISMKLTTDMESTGNQMSFVMEKIMVKGIVWDKIQPYLIISVFGKNKLLKQKEQYRGLTVVRINPRSAVIRKGKNNYFLRIGEEIVIK